MTDAIDPTTVTPICAVAKKRPGSSLRVAMVLAQGFALADQLRQAALAHGDDRHFRGGEEAVGENQHQDRDNVQPGGVDVHALRSSITASRTYRVRQKVSYGCHRKFAVHPENPTGAAPACWADEPPPYQGGGEGEVAHAAFPNLP